MLNHIHKLDHFYKANVKTAISDDPIVIRSVNITNIIALNSVQQR